MAVFPSQANTWVPSHEDSGKMVIDFSRNPNSFPLNKYIQIAPVKRSVGYYQKMTLEEAGRILDADETANDWADGQDAPLGNEGAESFEFLEFRCKRKMYRANIGDMAIDQASWDVVGQHESIKVRQAMTGRTVACLTVLTTSGNYASSHTATTTVAGGGTWDAATTANLYIRKSIDYAVNQIIQDTLAAVKPEDLILVVNPTLAKEMAESQEIVDYLKGSPQALAQVRGELPGRNVHFGLPDTLYGVNVVVEDTVKVTNKKGATRATSYALDSAKPFICSRPGGLIGVAGAPSFSTCTLFVYEPDELTVEVMHDKENRRVSIRVIDTRIPKMTADTSGFLFTGAT